MGKVSLGVVLVFVCFEFVPASDVHVSLHVLVAFNFHQVESVQVMQMVLVSH